MKKYISILAVLLMLSLTACSNLGTTPTGTGNTSNTQSESITMLDEGVWPVNEYTEGLPVPSGTVGWAMLDTEHENCSISIVSGRIFVRVLFPQIGQSTHLSGDLIILIFII